MTDIQATDSRTLRTLADGLKADAIAIQHTNRPEAMRLFRLFRQIVTELHRRNNPAIAHNWN